MNDETHHRALAAAVRSSLTCVSLALVPACEPKPRETTSPVAPANHAKPNPAPAEPNELDGATVTASESYGKPKVDPLPQTMTCEQRLDSALPTSGDVAGSVEVARRTKAVIDCCVALVHESSWDNPHFGQCCMVAQDHTDLPQACSPWGPAVPPSIRWTQPRGIA